MAKAKKKNNFSCLACGKKCGGPNDLSRHYHRVSPEHHARALFRRYGFVPHGRWNRSDSVPEKFSPVMPRRHSGTPTIPTRKKQSRARSNNPTQMLRYCTSCGARKGNDWVYCGHCGGKLTPTRR